MQTTGLAACITDRDLVVAAAGSGSRELEGKEISRELDMVISGREGKMIDGKVGIIYRSFRRYGFLLRKNDTADPVCQ